MYIVNTANTYGQKANIFSTYCISKMKYGRDESNKIGGDKKHPSKYRKRKYIEHNLKNNSGKQAQRNFVKG